MTREQAIQRASTLRKGKTLAYVTSDALELESFESINAAKRVVRYRIIRGFQGCVALRKEEHFPKE